MMRLLPGKPDPATTRLVDGAGVLAAGKPRQERTQDLGVPGFEPQVAPHRIAWRTFRAERSLR